VQQPSGQDIWNTVKQAGYAVVQVSNEYAPTLINSVRCAKARDNRVMKLAHGRSWSRLHNTTLKDNGVMCVIRFELAVHIGLV
jgi:hypothetical protein